MKWHTTFHLVRRRQNLSSKTMATSSELLELKLVLIGDDAAGKSNLFRRFAGKSYDGSIPPTIGVDFTSRIFELDQEKITVKVTLCDTTCNECHRPVTRTHYTDADGFIVVYDVNDDFSYIKASYLLSEINEFDANSSTKLRVLIGAKNDLPDKKTVSVEEAQTFADSNQLMFFETSAKADANIEDKFKSIVDRLYQMNKEKKDKC